jgi:DnaK suppressor protein
MTTTLDPLPMRTSAPASVTWDQFRHELEIQRTRCVQQRQLALGEAATALPDPVAVRRAASLLLTIEEIDAALVRMAEGTYGRCVHCGAGIPAERLEFRPFAAGCVDCQSPAR